MKTGTTIVIFGITGDLAQKKILPALYGLYADGRLPDAKIVGFSRREFSTDQINFFISSCLPDNFDKSFLERITYVQGQFNQNEDYQKLATHLSELDANSCTNKLFYLSVPPNLYETIFKQLALSGLSIPCGGEKGFARILIEKPFGNDLSTAQNLDKMLGELFKEEQIYRIDHYLAKESLYKIINLHRQDDHIEKRWNSEQISSVEINLFEKNVVGSRGSSYDPVGALRDVGQNHILQMLALVAMDISSISKDMGPEKSSFIQKARCDVLKNLRPYDHKNNKIIRGQYNGYLSEFGVKENSTTETFFRLKTFVDTLSFKDVPFILSSGKSLNKSCTELIVKFKNGMNISFEIPPEDSLSAYQKILIDCINGDQAVFVSTDEIMAEWSYITPIVEQTSNEKPVIYDVNSDPENIK